MKPIDFSYYRPSTLEEALVVLSEHADEAKVLAGGQSLVPLLNFRLARPEHVVDVGGIDELAVLREDQKVVSIGSMVRQARVEKTAGLAASCPLLLQALSHVAHPPIRARGTIGGSLAHADPAAELPAVARALDAVFVAESTGGRREIDAEGFFSSYFTTALHDDEVLVEVRFPHTSTNVGTAFEEVARRPGDFALVGAAVQLQVDDGVITEARICLSGVADVPLRCELAEELLVGSTANEHALDAAEQATRAVVRPVDDLHATAEFRRHLAGVLTRRAVERALERAESAPLG